MGSCRGEHLLEPARRQGLAELDGEVPDRRAVQPGPGQPGQKGQRPQHQDDDDGQVERAQQRRARHQRLQRLPDHIGHHQDHRDHRDRRHAAPARPGRLAPADQHDPEQQPAQRHIGQVGDRQHRVAVGAAVAEHQQVVRAASAAEPVQGHQQQLDHGQGHGGHVVGDDEHALQPGRGPAVREDGQQVGNDARGQGVREVPEREGGRGGDQDHGVEEQAEQGIAQPHRHHQRAGTVGRPARPGHQAGPHERPTHPDHRDQQVGERPRPTLARPEQQGEVDQARGEGGEGERQAQPRAHLIRLPQAARARRGRTAPPWG